jgi:hypothetical protein
VAQHKRGVIEEKQKSRKFQKRTKHGKWKREEKKQGES